MSTFARMDHRKREFHEGGRHAPGSLRVSVTKLPTRDKALRPRRLDK